MKLTCYLALALLAPAARADSPPDPLRFVPDRADVIVRVEQPRRLVEGFIGLEAVKELQKFDAESFLEEAEELFGPAA